MTDAIDPKGRLPVLGLSRRMAVQTLFGACWIMLAPGVKIAEAASLRPWKCPDTECGHIYDPAVGEPDMGIPPGVPFEDLPEDWECPECGTPKYLW